jgi:ubiquinone/menaquinone biosynthesis C-methylase UbiE
VKLSRRASLWINEALDRYLPPAIRDSRLFGNLARRMYDELTIDIVDLKDKAFYLSRAEFAAFYQGLRSRFDQGTTDLTPESLHGVLQASRGRSMLDVACGLGFVCERLALDHEVVGCDVAVSAGRRGTHPNVRWCDGNVEELPFRDGAFDTVISTHTLEHVQHLGTAISELRRVASKRVVIVVPRQRPYRATFNPHIHFFPYNFSLLAWTGTDRPHSLEVAGGDWLYIEDVEPEAGQPPPYH